MECSQHQQPVAATATLYENFLEEKCECDLKIPDYYPAAEKIIQCSADPVIILKEVEGDRLNLEGICRVCIIYEGEEEGGIRSLHENIPFRESLPLKEQGKEPWIQTVLRSSGVNCRLLNPRKISVRVGVFAAIKVKDQQMVSAMESVDCEEVESLFLPISVYTVLEHPSDTVKVQSEIEVHSPIQEILKADGYACVKDVRILPGKAIVKGVLNLFLLYTAENAPDQIETTSTAVPFSQVLELRQSEERGEMEAVISIQNLRTDLESDEQGKNRIISISATLMTEGELFENQPHRLLLDAYSNRHPISLTKGDLQWEELCRRVQNTHSLHHKIPMEIEDAEVIQALGNPMIQKISGKDKTLRLEGITDVSIFLKEKDGYRSVEKVLPFTLEVSLHQLDGMMRCEVHPDLLGMNWSKSEEGLELKYDLALSMTIVSRKTTEVIEGIEVDYDHPLEPRESAPLVVYYGEKGERLWDIARRYATSVSVLKSANELSGDVLEEKKLLLISCR